MIMIIFGRTYMRTDSVSMSKETYHISKIFARRLLILSIKT